jgi:hypothetical protein
VSETEQYTSGPTGLVPNSGLPLLVHRDAISGGEDMILETFRRNGWSGNWTYPGLFDYGHFHSSSHECLGCARGWMDIRVFGRTGSIVRIRKGDQGLILTLQRYWADQGCVVLQPYDMEVGAGTFHPATTCARWAPPVEGGLCAALAPAEGWPLWRKPEPPAALLPVPGDPEALAPDLQELYLGSL